MAKRSSLRIVAHTYRGTPGFSLRGKIDPDDAWPVRVFHTSREVLEAVREAYLTMPRGPELQAKVGDILQGKVRCA